MEDSNGWPCILVEFIDVQCVGQTYFYPLTMSQGPLGRCGMCVNTNTGWGHSQHSVLVHICHPSICHPLFWDICHPLFCDICHPLIVISATPFFPTIATRAFATPRNWFSIHKGGSLLCFRHIWFVSGSYYTFYPISKLDNSKLGSTQLFTLALGDRFWLFIQTLNNDKKPFNSIFNWKRKSNYSFKKFIYSKTIQNY